MSTFGIRQTFRTQPISRKIARTDISKKSEDSESSLEASLKLNTSLTSENVNLFDNNQNYFVNHVLNRSSTVQNPVLNPVNQSISQSLNKSVNQKNTELNTNLNSNDKLEKEKITSKMVSSRISLMKSHNRAVCRSEDHM